MFTTHHIIVMYDYDSSGNNKCSGKSRSIDRSRHCQRIYLARARSRQCKYPAFFRYILQRFLLFCLGSAGISNLAGGKEQPKELDLTLGYTIGGFNAGITDYWSSGGPSYLKYSAHNTVHVFEASLGYDFGVAAINWYTNFAGDDYKANGNRAYSSYVEINAPFKLGGLDFAASLGATPFQSSAVYGETSGFSVIDISLEASKDIKITESFSIPMFAKITMNPQTEGTYFVFGVSF